MIKFMLGDATKSLTKLDAGSVHCCVTSPPYFGLRDYGHAEQMGLESTPEEYVERMVKLFREVRRVLRDDGTLWIIVGDTYARNPKKGRSGTPNGRNTSAMGYSGGGGVPSGLKEKDLIGIPWMLAFALRADGWYLRQDIVWHKPNPMPEPAKDRFVKSHEYIFLLTKAPKYFFDYEAVKEQAVCQRLPGKGMQNGNDPKRNRRSVWSVTTKPYKGAHFATYPPDLVEPCLLAGCPLGGTVLDPFGGSGTTALVAQRHGRRAILCELNPDYMALAMARVLPPGLERSIAILAMQLEATSDAIGR